MRKLLTLATALSAAFIAAATVDNAKAASLTLCWAAWDPANALVELSKDFTKETGIDMKFEFVPWTNYADRFLNELNSHGKLCDLIIGDSQWIGGSAENGHYVKLNDFFDKEGISMDDFVPATVVGYSEWPKNTPNYWALPAMGDVVGWTYRKDWFARPELQKEFKEKYGWDLAPPTTYDQLKQIAEFFQGREIDGKKVYGASIYTERGSEGITMGVTNVLYDYGFEYQNPKKPYDMEGFVNSADAVKGLEFYKALYKCCTPPGASNVYMGEVGRRLQIRPGRDAHELRLHLARPLQGRECRRRQDRLLRQSGRPERSLRPARRAGHLGRRLLRQQDDALQVHQVVRAAGRAGEVVVSSAASPASSRCVEDPGFAASAPYAKTFLESMAIVKDFWAEPTYAELLQAMQKRVHDYVVADQGTAKEALDSLVKDWTEVFEEEGKM